MQGQGRPDRRIAQPKPQDEVAVEPLAGTKPNPATAVARLVTNGVQAASEIAGRCTAVVELDLQTEPDRVRKSRQQHRRADPRGVGNGVGIKRRAVAD